MKTETKNDYSFGVIPFKRTKKDILFLLVRHNAGHWSFPKGHKEGEESDIKTAEREFFEEVGISHFEIIDKDTFFTEEYFIDTKNKIKKEVKYFLCEVYSCDVSLQKDEIQDFGWFLFDDAINTLTFKEGRSLLKNAYKYLNTRLKEKNDILLVDKPEGITSFDVIRRLRKNLKIKKMGHAGTLDPLATGLMIIGVGPGTKKLKYLIGLDKVYDAEILIGVKTDTADVSGNILEDIEVFSIDEKKVKNILDSIKGENILPVPIFSAIKRGGEALYKKARRGEVFDPPKKKMLVYNADFLSMHSFKNKIVLRVRFHVASGVYIRSLAEKIGEELSLPATIKSLRRVKVGCFEVSDAYKI